MKLLCGPATRYGFGMAGGKSVKETGVVEDVFDLIVMVILRDPYRVFQRELIEFIEYLKSFDGIKLFK